MTVILILALLAAAGTFLAVSMVRIPSRPQTTWPSPTTLEGKVLRPVQALADLASQRRTTRGKPSLAEELSKADMRLRTSEFLMIQVGCGLLLGLLGLVRFGLGPQLLVAATTGFLAPMGYLRWRQRRRRRALSNQVPDTLNLLSNALKAGYSLAQALDNLSQSASHPISDEFARVVRETNLGGSVEGALHNLVRRVDNDDLELVVTVISIHAQVGGNLARILDNIAHTIRERVRTRAQIATLVAQTRASGWILTFLPAIVAGVLYLITPTYFRIMVERPLGLVLLAATGLLLIIGNVLIRQITAIKI